MTGGQYVRLGAGELNQAAERAVNVTVAKRQLRASDSARGRVRRQEHESTVVARANAA
jgi:hypothetical protein